MGSARGVPGGVPCDGAGERGDSDCLPPREGRADQLAGRLSAGLDAKSCASRILARTDAHVAASGQRKPFGLGGVTGKLRMALLRRTPVLRHLELQVARSRRKGAADSINGAIGDMIHAYDGSEEGIRTFSECGVESLKELLADIRTWEGGARWFLVDEQRDLRKTERTGWSARRSAMCRNALLQGERHSSSSTTRSKSPIPNSMPR